MPEQVTLPLIFPPPTRPPSDVGATTIVLDIDPRHPQGLPVVRLLTTAAELDGLDPRQAAALAGRHRGTPLLTEQYRPDFTRPGLRGFRPGTDVAAAGRDWSPLLRTESVSVDDGTLLIDASDPVAGLMLRTEVQALTGGALRARHTVRNTGSDHYLLEGLEVSVPLADDHTELLDFTGRHLRERIPQRHHVADGLWDKQSRAGRPDSMPPPCWSPGRRGSTSVKVRWSPRWWRPAATPATRCSAIGGGRRSSAPENCCSPARSTWRRSRATPPPGW